MLELVQGVFFNAYLLAYLISPRTCHAFVGYLEEEAVMTYTHAIKDLQSGKLPEWETMKAPDVAVKYWKMKVCCHLMHCRSLSDVWLCCSNHACVCRT